MSKQVVIDLELNKPSRKIIQLGYVIYGIPNFHVVETKRIYINPNEPLSSEIEKLCGISEEQLLNGTTLQNAYKTLCDDIENHHVNKYAVQWGLDHNFLREQLNIQWKDFVFKCESLNIKLLYYSLFTGRKKGHRGLLSAMQSLGMDWDSSMGLPHDALADSFNTMRIYQNIYKRMEACDQIQTCILGDKNG